MSTKFSQFNTGGNTASGDILVGLRGGLNTQFNYLPPVPLAGGTMTGLLLLSADPVASLGAATKQYVDTKVAAGGTVTNVALSQTGSFFTITGSPITTSGTINLAITGLLPLADGGTNANLTASNGGVFYSTATAGAILAGTATAGQLLLSGSTAAPTWSTSTYPATNAANTLLYASSTNTIAALATANNGTLITSAGGVPSISSTLPAAVQGNITAVGALASGSLAAGFTAVTVPLGGTGNTTFTAYSVICAGATSTGTMQNVSGLGTAGQILTSNGAGALPTWQAASAGTGTVTSVGLTQTGTFFTITGSPVTTSGNLNLAISGTLALANGGTNAALTASNGGIFYSTASAGAILAGTATAGQLLTSGASTTPAWTTSTYPATNAVNTLLYASSANVMAALATANNGALITSAGGVPSISSTLPAAVQGNITAVGTLTSLTVSGKATANNFIAGYTTTATAAATTTLTASSTQFQLFTGSTTQNVVLPDATTLSLGWYFQINNNSSGILTIKDSGSNTLFSMASGAYTQFICTNIGSANGTWDIHGLLPSNCSFGNAGATISGTLFVTGNSQLAGSANNVGTITTGVWNGTAIDLASYVSGNLAVTHLNSGTSASSSTFWRGDGSWATPAGGGATWVDQTGTSVTMAVNTNYVADNAALVTLTIPATAALGSTFAIVGKGAGGWLVQANTGQTVHLGSSTSSSAGSLASTNQYDCITITCITANTVFAAYAAQGNITVA
jgi:hypothetical protein